MLLFFVQKAKIIKWIPCIPQIFNDNKFIVAFKEESKNFWYFAKQFLVLDNGNALRLHFSLLTDKVLSVYFSPGEFGETISELGSNKAHRYGITSIWMLQIYGESIGRPLELNLKSHLGQDFFLSQ